MLITQILIVLCLGWCLFICLSLLFCKSYQLIYLCLIPTIGLAEVSKETVYRWWWRYILLFIIYLTSPLTSLIWCLILAGYFIITYLITPKQKT